jgi:hypothetical protein
MSGFLWAYLSAWGHDERSYLGVGTFLGVVGAFQDAVEAGNWAEGSLVGLQRIPSRDEALDRPL